MMRTSLSVFSAILLLAAVSTQSCGPTRDDCYDPFAPHCVGDTLLSYRPPTLESCGYTTRTTCVLGCSKNACLTTSLDGGAAFPVAFAGSFDNRRGWTQAVVLAERKPAVDKPSWEDVLQQGVVVIVETPLGFDGTRAVEGGLFNGGSRVTLVKGRGDAGAPELVDVATAGTINLTTTGHYLGAKSWGSFSVTFDDGGSLAGRFDNAPYQGEYDGGF